MCGAPIELRRCAWCASALSSARSASCSARCRKRFSRSRRQLRAWISAPPESRPAAAWLASVPPALLAAWAAGWDRRSRSLRADGLAHVLGRLVALCAVEAVSGGAAVCAWSAVGELLDLLDRPARLAWLRALGEALV